MAFTVKVDGDIVAIEDSFRKARKVARDRARFSDGTLTWVHPMKADVHYQGPDWSREEVITIQDQDA